MYALHICMHASTYVVYVCMYVCVCIYLTDMSNFMCMNICGNKLLKAPFK